MKVLITGAYGFLGSHIAKKILARGDTVIGVDRLNGAISAKGDRVDSLQRSGDFIFAECDISSWQKVLQLFETYTPDTVMHCAAQYSVPHNTDAMHRYVQSNLAGFMNIIEASKIFGVKRFHYASSTWVSDHAMPWTMYGATKVFNEHAANIYSVQFGMTTVGIRYGSCFGPNCRGDVGPHIGANNLLKGAENIIRGGFTYKVAFVGINDAVDCTLSLMDANMPEKHNVYTIVANDESHDLKQLVEYMAEHIGVEAKFSGPYVEQEGRVPEEALAKLESVIGYRPRTSIRGASCQFIDWLKDRNK